MIWRLTSGEMNDCELCGRKWQRKNGCGLWAFDEQPHKEASIIRR
jgi:hypothetical protein